MGSNAVRIKCGNDSMDWVIFIKGIGAIHQYFWIIKDSLIYYDWRREGNEGYLSNNVKILHLLFKDIRPLSESQLKVPLTWASLSRLMDVSASALSSDMRDKVYGMLAMMNPDIAGSISADYTVSPGQVFAGLAYAAYDVAKDLELLRECNICTTCLQRGPTWAPD